MSELELMDTHCHIHFPDYGLESDEVREAAVEAGVTRLLCVGCTLEDSELAVKYAMQHHNVWATIGLHPHESSKYVNDQAALHKFHELATEPKVVAIGETGLDYYYMNSSQEDQEKLFRFQLEVAIEHDLPLVFHVREAFPDFWRILDDYGPVRGVVHSFTAGQTELDEIIKRGLMVGINGIITFTKDEAQLLAAKNIPLENLLLETDAPFLTPVPFRGKICEPKYVLEVAKFLSDLRGENLKTIARASTDNAKKLFDL